MNKTINPITRQRKPCRRVRAEMSEYLDDELDSRAAARLENHLRWCPGCRRMLRNLARTVTGLHALGRRASGSIT